MEILEKTGEALSGLWLAFTDRERLLLVGASVAVLVFVSLEAARRARERELAVVIDIVEDRMRRR